MIAAVSKLAPSCSQPTRHGPLSLKALVYGTVRSATCQPRGLSRLFPNRASSPLAPF